MENIKYYIKSAILVTSVFFIWHLIVVGLFEISTYDDMQIFYVLAGTILTIYFYGKRKQI